MLLKLLNDHIVGEDLIVGQYLHAQVVREMPDVISMIAEEKTITDMWEYNLLVKLANELSYASDLKSYMKYLDALIVQLIVLKSGMDEDNGYYVIFSLITNNAIELRNKLIGNEMESVFSRTFRGLMSRINHLKVKSEMYGKSYKWDVIDKILNLVNNNEDGETDKYLDALDVEIEVMFEKSNHFVKEVEGIVEAVKLVRVSLEGGNDDGETTPLEKGKNG